MINKLEPKEWLELNVKLQQKKSGIRKDLEEMGILPKGGWNDYDKYKYYTEAQYKQLFTKLFNEHGLELNFSEIDYIPFENEGKQKNGRLAKVRFYLYDIDTGFYETTDITGEGIDKGDKAGYKAYTGALKYFLADKFMVATGDDPETESPDVGMSKKKESYKAKVAKLLKDKGVDVTSIDAWKENLPEKWKTVDLTTLSEDGWHSIYDELTK